ncbi:DUF6221 family protein [Streptosporangium sp. CA-135522]|uniref:DUF6221 family protein n=1 Tax=Streptosporangium sp. CA-135522 TaxID=3240072 RepID=UPI003D90CB47
MDDLIAFLAARLDEDEQTARLASEVYGKSWWWNPSWGLVKGMPDNDGEATSIFSIGEETVAEVWSEVGPHIARHDPDRVLRDINAKRAIIDEHPATTGRDGTRPVRPTCPTCSQSVQEGDPYPCRMLRLLLLPYADHPDYRQEWKP